jgi:hypothetical protein
MMLQMLIRLTKIEQNKSVSSCFNKALLMNEQLSTQTHTNRNICGVSFMQSNTYFMFDSRSRSLRFVNCFPPLIIDVNIAAKQNFSICTTSVWPPMCAIELSNCTLRGEMNFRGVNQFHRWIEVAAERSFKFVTEK